MQPTKARGPYAKGLAKREEVREIALETVGRRGYRGSTLREIADTSGITVAGVLHYFDSKEDLFAEVLRLRDTRSGEGLPIESPAGILLEVVRRNAGIPGLIHLFVALAAEATEEGHPAQGYFQAHYPRTVAWIADEIRELQLSGQITARVEPAILASIFVAAVDGMQIQWMHDPSIDMAARLEIMWNELILSKDQDAEGGDLPRAATSQAVI